MSGLNEREACCEEVDGSMRVRDGYDWKIALARSCIRGV